jgi:septal ring factor EnvC (AmiA/AmiB activator)
VFGNTGDGNSEYAREAKKLKTKLKNSQLTSEDLLDENKDLKTEIARLQYVIRMMEDKSKEGKSFITEMRHASARPSELDLDLSKDTFMNA